MERVQLNGLLKYKDRGNKKQKKAEKQRKQETSNLHLSSCSKQRATEGRKTKKELYTKHGTYS